MNISSKKTEVKLDLGFQMRYNMIAILANFWPIADFPLGPSLPQYLQIEKTLPRLICLPLYDNLQKPKKVWAVVQPNLCLVSHS